ncbi:MAG: MlaD family protein [Rhodospirillales bacterium]|jgi:phospholipid/cholesterol/gamma-HCH transport system substrate-binding protein|nr:MlaD family protein [Rhodospirillales bacterium]
MKGTRINYAMVGGFVIAMTAVLVIAVVILSGGGGATDNYHAVYRNVTGVKYGTQVLYEGYPVGQVERVTPEPAGGGMRFRVDVSVRRGWRIPSDSVAAIQAPGLLSAIVIAISEGSGSTSLKPGERIESREAENLFAAMASVVGQLGEFAEGDLKPLIVTLNRAVGNIDEIAGNQGRKLVDDLGGLAADLAERLPAIVDDVQILTHQMQIASGEFSKLFSPANRRTLEGVLARTEATVGNLSEFSRDISVTRSRIDGVLETLDTLLIDNKLDVERAIIDLRHVVESVARHIDILNQNMEGASRNMYEFSRQIRENPGLLLGGTPPPDQAAGSR